MNPALQCVARLLRDLELDGVPRLVLHNSRSGANSPAQGDVCDPQVDQVAASQLTVEREIEQGQVTQALSHLQSDANGPDLFQLEGRFGAHKPAPVPGPAALSLRSGFCKSVHRSTPSRAFSQLDSTPHSASMLRDGAW